MRLTKAIAFAASAVAAAMALVTGVAQTEPAYTPLTVAGRAANCLGFPEKIVARIDRQFPSADGDLAVALVQRKPGARRVEVYVSSTGCKVEPIDPPTIVVAPGRTVVATVVPDWANRKGQNMPAYVLVQLAPDRDLPNTDIFVAVETQITPAQLPGMVA